MKKYLFVILCMLLTSIGMTYCADATEAKISSPLNGTMVPKIIDVELAVKDIPTGQDLWIGVYPLDVKRYYIQDKRHSPIVRTISGNLSTEARIGIDFDDGLRFRLVTIVANRTAMVAILDYMDKSNKIGSWPGLVELPDGAVIYDTKIVTRG
jgi:hypothetical protein